MVNGGGAKDPGRIEDTEKGGGSDLNLLSLLRAWHRLTAVYRTM